MIESAEPPTSRQRAKRSLMKLFSFGDRLGIHVMPAHYYSPVAHRRWLRANEPAWRHRHPLVNVEWDLEAQAQWVADTAGSYPAEVPIDSILARADMVGGF